MRENYMRKLIKTFYDYQHMRIVLGNRLGIKKDGTEQKLNSKNNIDSIVEKDNENYIIIQEEHEFAVNHEDFLLDRIKEIIQKHPLWTGFLKDVKGCGELMAAVIIGEFDIDIASNVSKMYAYAGLSPGTTKGKKWNKAKTKIIKTDTEIRQDKKTPGFLCPYNQWLRSKLIGVLGSGFIKSKSEYSKIYYDFHVPDKYRTDKEAMKKRPELAGRFGRYDQSEKIIFETEKGGKIVEKAWKDTSEAHRHKAATRKMVKIFLYDLYKAWRTIMGLPVRNLYAEEYLGKKHDG